MFNLKAFSHRLLGGYPTKGMWKVQQQILPPCHNGAISVSKDKGKNEHFNHLSFHLGNIPRVCLNIYSNVNFFVTKRYSYWKTCSKVQEKLWGFKFRACYCLSLNWNKTLPQEHSHSYLLIESDIWYITFLKKYTYLP